MFLDVSSARCSSYQCTRQRCHVQLSGILSRQHKALSSCPRYRLDNGPLGACLVNGDYLSSALPEKCSSKLFREELSKLFSEKYSDMSQSNHKKRTTEPKDTCVPSDQEKTISGKHAVLRFALYTNTAKEKSDESRGSYTSVERKATDCPCRTNVRCVMVVTTHY